MSTTIASIVIQLLTIGLPFIGVTVGSEDLTHAVQTGIIVFTGIWIWIQRVKQGDVTPLGMRK